MTPQRVEIVEVDVFDPIRGLLFPLLIQRILDYGKTLKIEVSQDALAQAIALKMAQRSPYVKGIVFVQGGKVVGHAIGSLEQLGADKWVFIEQCRIDPKVNAGDAIPRVLRLAEDWGREFGATRLMFGTHRNDAAWQKKHKFETVKHLMVRRIGENEGTVEQA